MSEVTMSRGCGKPPRIIHSTRAVGHAGRGEDRVGTARLSGRSDGSSVSGRWEFQSEKRCAIRSELSRAVFGKRRRWFDTDDVSKLKLGRGQQRLPLSESQIDEGK
jgi:hypothetical protein